MATTIVLKNSVTTTNAPSSLTQGEAAVNVTDKKVWVGNAATTPIQLLGSGADATFNTVTANGFSGPLNGTVGATTPADGKFTTLSASTSLGVGTTTPSTKLDVVGSIALSGQSTGDQFIRVGSGRTGSGYSYVDLQGDSTYADGLRLIRNPGTTGGSAVISQGTGNFQLITTGNAPLLFVTNNSERMRLDTGGVLYVGNTTGAGGVAGAIASNGNNTKAGYAGGFSGHIFNINFSSSADLYIDTTNLGTITTVSDYRIKRNVETQTESGLEKILKLRPITYQMANYGSLFKEGTDVKEGFIAHEVQEIIPSGADGKKDAENQIQSLRVDAILSVAVKAIQELSAKVDAQAAEIAALKVGA